MISRKTKFILLLVTLMALAPALYAQTSFGEVNGTVVEQTGAVVAGGTVTLINQATNIETKRSTRSSRSSRITPRPNMEA